MGEKVRAAMRLEETGRQLRGVLCLSSLEGLINFSVACWFVLLMYDRLVPPECHAVLRWTSRQPHFIRVML